MTLTIEEIILAVRVAEKVLAKNQKEGETVPDNIVKITSASPQTLAELTGFEPDNNPELKSCINALIADTPPK